jgi:DNA-binding CsgD family transcriptional regulator
MTEVDPASPFTSLTDEQLEALRLVRDGFTSKQIAQQLNISRWAVDQRVDRARARLAAADRAEAARMLTAWERKIASERFVREPQSLPDNVETANIVASYAAPSAAAGENRVREMPARYGESGGLSSPGHAMAGASAEVRNPLHTLVLIVLATVGLVIVMLALPSLVRNAQDIANMVKPYHSIPRH